MSGRRKTRIGPKARQITELTVENRRLKITLENVQRSFALRVKGQADRITQLRSGDGWIENAANRYLNLLEEGTTNPFALNARELLAQIFRMERDGGVEHHWR